MSSSMSSLKSSSSRPPAPFVAKFHAGPASPHPSPLLALILKRVFFYGNGGYGNNADGNYGDGDAKYFELQ